MSKSPPSPSPPSGSWGCDRRRDSWEDDHSEAPLPPITVDAIAKMQFRSTLGAATPEMLSVVEYIRRHMDRAWKLFPENIFNIHGNDAEEDFCGKLLERALGAIRAESVRSLQSPVSRYLIEAGLHLSYSRKLGGGSCLTFRSALLTTLLCDYPGNGALADYRLATVDCRTRRPKGRPGDPYAGHGCLALIHRAQADHVMLLHGDLRKVDILRMSEIRDCLGMYCRETRPDRLLIEHFPLDVTFPYLLPLKDWDDITKVQATLLRTATKAHGDSDLGRKVMDGVDDHLRWWVFLVCAAHGIHDDDGSNGGLAEAADVGGGDGDDV